MESVGEGGRTSQILGPPGSWLLIEPLLNAAEGYAEGRVLDRLELLNKGW